MIAGEHKAARYYIVCDKCHYTRGRMIYYQIKAGRVYWRV